MSKSRLSGVIAAVATATDGTGEPDGVRSVALARFLLDHGCDGLNVLGTTGEATSYSLAQRQAVMNAYRSAGLPLERMMVGSGAAATADAVALTRHAAELGFDGALVLPPFYYKGVPDDGLAGYVAAIVKATADRPIPLYLYHYPQLSGVPWHANLIRRMLTAPGPSSSAMAIAAATMSATSRPRARRPGCRPCSLCLVTSSAICRSRRSPCRSRRSRRTSPKTGRSGTKRSSSASSSTVHSLPPTVKAVASRTPYC